MRRSFKKRVSALLIASMILSLNAPVYAQDLIVDDTGSLLEEDLIAGDEALVTEDTGTADEALISDAPDDVLVEDIEGAGEALDDNAKSALPEGDEGAADMLPVKAGNEPVLETSRVSKTFAYASVAIPKTMFPEGTTEDSVRSNYSLQLAAIDVTGKSDKTVSLDEISSSAWKSATFEGEAEETAFAYRTLFENLQAGREYMVCYKLLKQSGTDTIAVQPQDGESVGDLIARYEAMGYSFVRESHEGYVFSRSTTTIFSKGQVDSFETVVSYTGSMTAKKESVEYKDLAPFKNALAPELAINLSGNDTITKQNIKLEGEEYAEYKSKYNWTADSPACDMNAYVGLAHSFNVETGDVDLLEDDFLQLAYTITDPATGASVLNSGSTLTDANLSKPVSELINYGKLSSNGIVSVNVTFVINDITEAQASCELTIAKSKAYVYPVIKSVESSNIKKDGGEFYVTAGKDIAYGDFATDIRLNQDPDDPRRDPDIKIKDGGNVAYILTQGTDTKILLPDKTVSFANLGPVTVKVSQNGAELSDPSCIFTEEENDKNNKLTVIKPNLTVSVKNPELPYGYVTKELKKEFDIKNFVKVTDSNQGGKDITDSSYLNYEYTVSDSNVNAADINYSKKLTGGKVGDTLYVRVSYAENSSLNATLASGITVTPQKITAYPASVEKAFTEDASKAASSTTIESLSFIDEEGKVDAASTVTESSKVKKYVSGDAIGKLEFSPTDRKLYNKIKYSPEYDGPGLMIPVTITQTADKPAGSYAVTVEPCQYFINPTVAIFSEDIEGKRTDDRLRGAEKSYSEFTGLSENNLKEILGEDVYSDASIPKYMRIRAVYDGTDGYTGEVTVTTSFNNLADPSKWYTSDGFLSLDGHYSDGLTEALSYVRDVYVKIYASENKYTGIASITMDPIDDVTYTGFAHIADTENPGKNKTADLNIHVYSNLGGVKRELIPGTDYKVSYKNNTKACLVDKKNTKNSGKWPTVIVKGRGAYAKMELVEYFNINKADVDIISVTGTKDYYKLSRSEEAKVSPKFLTFATGGSKASVSSKEKVSFRIISADSKLGLKDPENYGTEDGKGKITYKGKEGLKMRVIVSSSGGENFNKSEALTDVTFYVFPYTSNKFAAKWKYKNDKIEWKNVKNIDKLTGLRTVSVCDFAGKETEKGWDNLEVKVGNTPLDKKYYNVFLCADNKTGIPLEGGATTQVGTYYLKVVPTEEGLKYGGLLADAKYIKVNYKTDQKLGNAIGKNGVIGGFMTRFDTGYKAIPQNGMEIVDPSYGFKLSINKLTGLANDVRWVAYDLTNKTPIYSDKEGGMASNKTGAVVNPGMTPENVNPGTYSITFYGSGAYAANDKVTINYKVAAYKAGDGKVRIRVVSGNEDGTIPYNAGGYIYELYKDLSSPTGYSPYTTDDYGHVDLVLQTQVSGNWVDNAYLTENLRNAKVSIKNDKEKAKIKITNLKTDNGKALVSGTISTCAQDMTIRSSLSGNSSIYLYNNGLTEKNVGKFEKSLVLYQYSAAKGLDSAGNYNSVALKLTKDYTITGKKLAVGLSENAVILNGGENGYFKITDPGYEISNAGKDKKDWNKALAVGKVSYSGSGIRFGTSDLFANKGELAYRNGLKCTHDKITLKDKGGNTLLTLNKENGYKAVLSENGIDVTEVEALYANNRDIGNGPECTLIFTPLADSNKAYIGSKLIKFKIK